MPNATMNKWQRRMVGLRDQHGSRQFAAKVGFSQRAVRGWLSQTAPQLPKRETVEQIAKNLGGEYPHEEQLRDLGWHHEMSAVPRATARQLESSRLLLNQLSLAVRRLTVSHLGVVDLVSELLASCDRDTACASGRWSCRVFEVSSGKVYPHAVIRGVEFQLTPGQQPWREEDWHARDENPRGWNGLGEPWVGRRLDAEDDDPGFLDPGTDRDGPGRVVTRDLAWERLELVWRLRGVLPLVYGSWVGEVGRQFRTLLMEPDNTGWRHIYIGHPYQERSPDPGDRALGPAGQSQILLIGAGALKLELVASIMGDALGYHAYTARHLAEQVTGLVHQYSSPERAAAFATVWDNIREAPATDHRIVSVYDLDTLLTLDQQALTDQAKKMLLSPHVLPILLAATPPTLDAWLLRQMDRRLPYGQDAIGGAHDPDVITRALTLAHDLLRTHRSARSTPSDPAAAAVTAAGWRAWGVKVDLPWEPIDTDASAVAAGFLRPEIGDYLVRLACAISRNVVRGKDSTPRTLHFADHSLLWRLRRDLFHDPDVDEILVGTKDRVRWDSFVASGSPHPSRGQVRAGRIAR